MTVALETARDILLDLARVTPQEAVPLVASWRRVLAQDVTAPHDFPPFDRSPLDGYAVVAAEVTAASPAAPVVLRQIGNVPAGSVAAEKVIPGTACRIMTGAPIPPGATGVVRLEDTVVHGREVYVFHGAGAAANICRQGEEIRRGERVLAAGTVINAGVMGLLAVLGVAAPLVYRRPRVALLATGSEIVPVDAPLGPGQIRNSNTYMLTAQVNEAGAEVAAVHLAPDDADIIAARLAAMPPCDVVVTTGGASVGDYDLVAAVYQRLGIKTLFSRVSMKPGMPVLAGVKDGQLFLGLSGNPAAAAVAFEQLVRPLLLKMGGRRTWTRPAVRAVLAAPFGKSTGVKRFVWGCVRQGPYGLEAEPLANQGNGMLRSAAQANALIIIPPDSPPLPAGTVVEVILLWD